MELAEQGAIVVFNVSEFRSDAFLVTRQDIRSIPLPLLTADDMSLYSARFLKAIQEFDETDYLRARRELKRILEWLWDVAVFPVLDTLGHTQTPTGDEVWPRVWWVGSGLLNLLPIHAAGYHDSIPPRAAMDFVISSYTSTLNALAYARTKLAAADSRTKQRAMLIGMTKTPGYSDLGFVENELAELEQLLSSEIIATVVEKPTSGAVLSMLNNHQIIHLACHGSCSNDDPSQSKLLLEDWQSAPLTVSQLAAQNLGSSQFAYLSACDTAMTRNLRLLDESIHLASALQLAGYPSVIGTLWEIRDESSVAMARDVYAWMLGQGYLDTTASAEGLHRAARELREKTRTTVGIKGKGPSDPLVWAPYIHFGI